MIRSLKVAAFLVLALMVMASALPALADDNVTGDWSGSWNGNGKTGAMNGSLESKDGKVTGNFTLQGTVKGDLSGPLSGTITQFGEINGTMTVQGMTLNLSGWFADNNIAGGFSNSELGDGNFNINRE